MLPPVPVTRQTFSASLPAIALPRRRRRDSSGRGSGAVRPGDDDASYRLTRLHSPLDEASRTPGRPRMCRRLQRPSPRAFSDRRPTRIREIHSCHVPQRSSSAGCRQRALATPRNRPNSWRPCLRGGAVIGGDISSIEQMMHWLAPRQRFERLRRVKRATRVVFQTAGGGEAP
jgi:hypothetical protein